MISAKEEAVWECKISPSKKMVSRKRHQSNNAVKRRPSVYQAYCPKDLLSDSTSYVEIQLEEVEDKVPKSKIDACVREKNSAGLWSHASTRPKLEWRVPRRKMKD